VLPTTPSTLHVDMGRTLHKNMSGANINDRIATEMRNKLVSHIIENNCKIAIFIDESTTKVAKHYGCSTMAGPPARQLNGLQLVLNAAARLVYSARRTEHVSPLLRELH